MRVLVQRVQHASVKVDGEVVGSIGAGYLALLGITHSDTKAVADKMVDKLYKLRIFKDENGKANRSLGDVGGALLVISQFTLYANTNDGNRPGFDQAAKGEQANELYEYFLQRWRDLHGEVQHGKFGADMKVELLNDGPFTVLLEL